jgi:hypothetical protein
MKDEAAAAKAAQLSDSGTSTGSDTYEIVKTAGTCYGMLQVCSIVDNVVCCKYVLQYGAC